MEDDKKVKDSTVPDKAPEKNLKKPTGKSATGKPLDGIDINPQLNDVSTDGNQLKIRKEDSVDLTAPVIQERKALTLPQRQKRARTIRSHERSMERAREVAKKKLAPTTQLEKRALSHARAIVKKRFAARKGTPYAELTTSEKIAVDTAVSKKTKLIQKIAARLLPRIRKAEFERLKSFRNGGPLQDLSTQNPKAQGIMPKVTEEMSQLFNTLNDHDVTSLIGIIENAIEQFKQDNDPMGDQLKKMLTAVLPEDVVTESLLKKSDKTGIPFSTLKEVFERGEYSWDESNRMTQEQYAFARVNSYIGKGKAWHMDADLREEKTINAKLDESFAAFLEASIGTKIRKKIEIVDRPPADQAVKARQQEIQKKIIDEAKAKPYVKPFHNEKGEHVGWKSSNGHHVKFWRLADSAKKKAYEHAGITEHIVKVKGGYELKSKSTGKNLGKYPSKEGAEKRERQVQFFKHQHEETTSLDESFNMAWTSGIGVTLSAADCGIKIKGGFALHPDVVEQMNGTEFDEEVRSADVKGEIVAGHKETRIDPKTGKQTIVNVPAHVSKGKLRRKIIGSGDVHNGDTE